MEWSKNDVLEWIELEDGLKLFLVRKSRKRQNEYKKRRFKNKVDKKQTIDTLINEEALLLAKFLRGEIKTWNLRIILEGGFSPRRV